MISAFPIRRALAIVAILSAPVAAGAQEPPGGVLDAAESELDYLPGVGVRLRALDKLTARTRIIEARLDDVAVFGTLRIETLACRASPPLEPPEAKAYLRIVDTPLGADEDGAGRTVFSGWMFASDPAANPLEHAVYDIWPIACIAASPESEAGAADQSPVN